MRTILTFIFIVVLIHITHIDAVIWPVIKHGSAAVNEMIQHAK